MTTEQRAKQMRKALQLFAQTLTDENQMIEIASIYPIWKAGHTYIAGDVIQYGEAADDNVQLYSVVQDHTSQAHQPPDAPGMLAIYRPIVKSHSGTIDDPIPWIYGMDCYNGKYYTYNEHEYLCKSDMPACVWAPDSGIWQWELVA